MTERVILVGVIPQVQVIDPGEEVVWVSDAGALKVEFDPKRCPFSSNVYQAPAGVRLQSGAPHPGAAPGAYKYRISLDDHFVARGEIILRKE